MTAANSAANGASLEDCHTNLFALTDLSGIKWRKLSAPCPTEQAVGPLEDPVLISFSRCLAANILCVWRRVAHNSNLFDLQPVSQTSWEKELWIYWYGDDPNWDDLISPELKDVDQGTWDNGLSYECRTLLFKSLHNLIERCLLSRNLVRLGRWFIRPYDGLPHPGENFSDHLSFAFSFFLHGESTVCASVGTMLHQPISRLTSDHLAIAQGSATVFQVVLVPYGMSGVLTGHSFKASHQVAQKIIHEWKHFYPVVPEEIKKEAGEDGADDQQKEDDKEKEVPHWTVDFGDDALPAVVEVMVGGVRLLYPSVYVMVPHSDEMMPLPTTPQPMGSSYMPPPSTHATGSMKMSGMTAAAMSTISLTPPTSPPDQQLLGDPKLSMMPPPGMSGTTGGGYTGNATMDTMYGIPEIVASPKTVASKLAGKIWKDWTLPRDTGRVSPAGSSQTSAVPPSVSNAGSQPAEQQPPSNNQPEEGPGAEMKSTATNTSSASTNMWEFVDPATKISNCGCSRQKSLKAKGSGTQFGKPQSMPGHSSYGSSSSSKHKSDSKQERQQRNQRPITPFHHRAMMTEDFIAIEHEMANQRLAAAAAATTAAMGPSSQQDVKLGGSANAKFTQPSPAFRPVGTADSSLTESPPSVAPSPLVPPPTSTTNPNERTMPTLSPYPPARSGSDSGTPTTSNAPTVLPRTELAMNGLDSHDSGHLDIHKMPGEHGGGHSMEGKEEGSEEDLLWQCFKLPLGQHVDYKRPLLPHQNCEGDEGDENGLDSLYDADNNNEVFSQPVKKLKQERTVPLNNYELMPGVFSAEMDMKSVRMPSPDPIDPYEFDDTSPTTNPNERVRSRQQGRTPSSHRMKGQTIKGKPKGLIARRNSKKLQERKKQEEEAQRRASEEEKLKHEQQAQGGQQNGVDGPLSNLPKVKPDTIGSSLTQEKDLMVGPNDLDNLFESSSDDEMGGVEYDDITSKLPGPNTEENTKTMFGASLNSSTNLQGTVNTSTELARMFPTPPSLEQQNSAFSPLNQQCTEYVNHGSVQGMGQTEQNNSGDFADIEVDESMLSPKPEPIEDWNFVYKVPIMERIVGPSIYAPLKSLPSSKLPPLRITEACNYKATWQKFSVEDLTTTRATAYQEIATLSDHADGRCTDGNLLPLSPKPDFLPVTKESTVQNLASVDTDLLNSQQVGRTPPAASSTIQSPAMYPGSQEPRSAANPELQSPASETSSYARNLNSLEAPTPSNNIPEAHSLYVNLVLSDSLLNVFKDRNFDSCVICACNMNIKGADAALYAPDLGIPCSCGFSEIMNRRYAVGSGLFVEDESEITGQATDVALWAYHRDNPYCAGEISRKGALGLEGPQSKDTGNEIQRTSNALLKLIQDQCNTPYSTLCRLNSIARRNINSSGQLARSQLEIDDGCAVCFAALEQGRFLMAEGLGTKLPDDALLRSSCLHSWPYTPGVARGLLSSQDIVRTLSSLQPLLQDAIQKKRTMRLWERPYMVQGPLTWQVFFNIAVKSTSESPEPLPIPPLLVGFDKDWLSSSPFTLHYWEKLLLEPYSAQRDVAYIALVPDNDHVLQCALPFFKELTAVYETCKLGRHAPIAKTQRDGIFRIGKKYAEKVATESVDSWFTEIGSLPEATKLKLYAQVCKAYVAPLLNMHPPDSSLFTISRHDRSGGASNTTSSGSTIAGSSHSSGGSGLHGSTIHGGSHIGGQSHGSSDHGTSGSAAAAASASTSMPAPSQTPVGSGSQKDKSDSSDNKETVNNSGIPDIVDPKDLEQPPAVVIYIVDPFTYGEDSVDDLPSVATLGLLKCFTEIFDQLNNTLQRNIVLQIVPIQQVLQVSNSDMSMRLLSQMKTLAFSVFSQCRRHLRPSILGRSLTSFGPAADLEKMMKESEREAFTRIYSPPYILASLKDKQTELGESFGELSKQCGELFCSYCLSHDQRWMLVSCTDSKGEFLETQVINIDVPNRKRRKKVSVRHIAFTKLWDFLMGIISKTAIPWRLVIGRFGRIGQGELRDWSILLSRRSLNNQTKILKDMCRMCNVQTNSDFPCILSACLVSIEPEPGLKIMADSVAADKCSKNSQRDQPSCQLHTPDDATCTHILVFPTSATKQVASAAPVEPILDLNFGAANENVDDLISTFAEVEGLGFDMEGLLGLPVSPTMTSPVGSPGAPQSPNGSPSASRTTAAETSRTMAETSTQLQPTNILGDGEIEAAVLQQPLALGYFVSTAKTGPLPEWFWSTCPEAEHSCPVFLKAALHVHNVQQTSDEILQTKHTHPLDSNLTTDPLRYVLETYNSLSWLTVDPASGDRRSCLPVHMVVLVQLYNSMAALL